MNQPPEAGEHRAPADSSRSHPARVWAVLVVVLAAVAGALWFALRRTRPVQPDVLLLVMDTTRADRCSLTGYARETTPRLDAFAKDAVVFGNAWTSSNWTGPAHASLFTGLSPERHGFESRAQGLPRLNADLPTLAEQFAAAGYDTGCFTNNPVISPEFALTRGFHTVQALYRDAASLSYPWAKRTHELAADWAEAAHAAGRRFFLFINDMEPHLPYEPPADAAAKFIRGDPSTAAISKARAYSPHESLAYDLRLADLSAAELALLSDLYDAEIFALDREIGVLLDRLKSAGILDSTLVVVLGDHGEFLGEHHFVGHECGAYRAVLQVPLLLRLPGVFDGGRKVGDVVRIEDVAPTITKACGLEPLPDAVGIALQGDVPGRVARALHVPKNLASGRAKVEFPAADRSLLEVGIRSVFDGSRQLLAFADGHHELYAPQDDPDETNDLAAREPTDVARLTTLLNPAK